MAEITGDLTGTVTVKKPDVKAKIVKVVQGTVSFDPETKGRLPADAKGYTSFASDSISLAEALRRLSDIFPDRNFLLVSTPQELKRKPVYNDEGEALYMELDMNDWQIMSDGDDWYVTKVLGAIVLGLQEQRRLKYRETGNLQHNVMQGGTPDVPEEGDPPTKLEDALNAMEAEPETTDPSSGSSSPETGG